MKTIIGVASEHLTDEDLPSTSKVTKIIADSFMRRPSLDDEALRKFTQFAADGFNVNNRAPQDKTLCDGAYLLLLKNKGRFISFGNSRVFRFEGGVLVASSKPSLSPPLGGGTAYLLELEPGFELTSKENAFLVCTGALCSRVKDEEITLALNQSQTAAEWMEKLRQKAGDCQFCAVTCLLPPPRKRMPAWMLLLIVLALAALILWLILK